MNQSNNSIIYATVFAVLISFLIGCGGDDFGDNDRSIADSELNNKYQIPTITIENIRTEKLEGGERVWWRLKANPAPKTDLAVRLARRFRDPEWVIIPKSKNNSETFATLRSIEIQPLPMVSIVGKGLVVDLELLQRNLPDDSLGGHRIPKDFDFPVYNVGEPAQIQIVLPEIPEIVSAKFSSANPASGSVIAPNAIITLTFSSDPGEVTVAGATVIGSSKTRTVAGPFAEGHCTLAVSWTNGDGSTSLSYTVKAPDNTAPTITGGTVSDGDKDVDPAEINEGAIIELTFSEEVTGNITLQTEAGDDVGWIGSVEGNRGRLELVRGKEIGNETTYVIRGVVRDTAGNETEISITFTTGRFRIDAPGLTAVWLFDEGIGNEVLDSSGNKLDGRIDGDARWVKGKFGTALEFAGQGQGIVIENDIAFNFEESMTLMGWFYLNDEVIDDHRLITKKDSFYVGFLGGGGWLEFVIQPDDTNFFTFPPHFNNELRKWHHFAVTFDWKGITTFYINGDRGVRAGGKNNVLVPSEAELIIGGFPGIIDEVALYNRVLPEHEIIEIMENGFVH